MASHDASTSAGSLAAAAAAAAEAAVPNQQQQRAPNEQQQRMSNLEQRSTSVPLTGAPSISHSDPAPSPAAVVDAEDKDVCANQDVALRRPLGAWIALISPRRRRQRRRTRARRFWITVSRPPARRGATLGTNKMLGQSPAALAASSRTTASVPMHAASERSVESIDFYDLTDNDGDHNMGGPDTDEVMTDASTAARPCNKCHAPPAPTLLCHNVPLIDLLRRNRVPTSALLVAQLACSKTIQYNALPDSAPPLKDIASVRDVEGNKVGRNRAEKIQHQYNIAVQGVRQIATFLHASNAAGVGRKAAALPALPVPASVKGKERAVSRSPKKKKRARTAKTSAADMLPQFPPAITDIDALFLGPLLKEVPAIDATAVEKLVVEPVEAPVATTLPVAVLAPSATADTPDSAAVATEFVIDLDVSDNEAAICHA
ncbi:hypothetical protein DFJ73DRAFT_778018 [Zopfochytrium polystomum]|nr:hypothetical protein DFJ73DRAFT_778018 [Zopfochytrium polystomum]